VASTTVSPLAGADDGGAQYSSTSWPANGGTFSATSSGREYVIKSLASGSGVYDQFWYCIRFNMDSPIIGSVIPVGNPITAADLLLTIAPGEIYNTHNIYNLEGGFYDYGGQPMVPADWVLVEPAPCFSVPLSSLSSGLNTIPLTALGGINKTGYTGIRLNLSAGTPPSAIDGDGLRIAAWDDPTNQEPRLVITHGVPPPGSRSNMMLLGAG
jgi:hypothetical protein